jgi:hypothetical protein
MSARVLHGGFSFLFSTRGVMAPRNGCENYCSVLAFQDRTVTLLPAKQREGGGWFCIVSFQKENRVISVSMDFEFSH